MDVHIQVALQRVRRVVDSADVWFHARVNAHVPVQGTILTANHTEERRQMVLQLREREGPRSAPSFA